MKCKKQSSSEKRALCFKAMADKNAPGHQNMYILVKNLQILHCMSLNTKFWGGLFLLTRSSEKWFSFKETVVFIQLYYYLTDCILNKTTHLVSLLFEAAWSNHLIIWLEGRS